MRSNKFFFITVLYEPSFFIRMPLESYTYLHIPYELCTSIRHTLTNFHKIHNKTDTNQLLKNSIQMTCQWKPINFRIS
jgi:hypothetical protein